EQTEFHLMFTGADNNLGAVVATPVQLLSQRWSTVYTWPQTTHQQLAFGQATGAWKPTDTLSFQGVGYYRQLWQQHIDGNSTDAQSCTAPLLGDRSQLDGVRQLWWDAAGDQHGPRVRPRQPPRRWHELRSRQYSIHRRE